MTVVFGFWFNIGDSTQRNALFLPLSLFAIVFSLYASLLIFTHSKSYHEYFFYAEEMIDRYHDVKMKQKDPPKDRKFFARKWDEAREKFWDEKLNNVLVLWIFPILTYSGALLLASFYTNRFDKQRRTKNSTEQ